MRLKEEYKEQTGMCAEESVNGWICVTESYVEWLENKIENLI